MRKEQWAPSNKRMVMVRPPKNTLLTSKDLLYVIYDANEIDLDSLEIKREEGISNQDKFQFYGADFQTFAGDFVSDEDEEEVFNSFSGLVRKDDLKTAKFIKKIHKSLKKIKKNSEKITSSCLEKNLISMDFIKNLRAFIDKQTRKISKSMNTSIKHYTIN